MKTRLILPLALAGQFFAGTVHAQGADVRVFRLSGPQLGVRLEEVDGDAVSRLKLKEEKGAVVTEVLEDSAASKAGIKKDDVIVRFQGESILTAAQLTRLVRDVPSGRKVDIDVIRNGAPMKVTATLERREFGLNENAPMVWNDKAFKEQLDQRLGEKMGKLNETLKDGKGRGNFNFNFGDDGMNWGAIIGNPRMRLGVTYSEIDGQLASFFKAPKEHALLVNSVVADSPAAKAGIKAGDLIVKVGDHSVEDGSDLRDAIDDATPGKDTRMTVWRDGRNVDLSVAFAENEKPKIATARKRRSVS